MSLEKLTHQDVVRKTYALNVVTKKRCTKMMLVKRYALKYYSLIMK